MPPVRTLKEVIAGMEFRSRARGNLIADMARTEGVTLGLLQAADEIERLITASSNGEEFFPDVMTAWIRATREAAAMSAQA